MDDSFTGSLASFGSSFGEDTLEGGVDPLSQQALQDDILRALLLNYGLVEDLEASSSFTSLGRTTTLREMRHAGSLGDVDEEAQTTLLGSTLWEYSEMASPVRASDARSMMLGGSVGALSSSATLLGNTTTIEEFNRLRAGIDQFIADPSLLNSTSDSHGFAASFSSVRSSPTWLGNSMASSRHLLDEESVDVLENTNSSQLLVGLGGASTSMSQTSDSNGLEDSLPSILQRLNIDESLARAVRQVLQMGAVLAGARLADDEIQALPKVRFEQADEQQCSICLETFRSGELLTELPCRHFFHVDCVANWFQRSTRCPLCRVGAVPGAVEDH